MYHCIYLALSGKRLCGLSVKINKYFNAIVKIADP
jgi:hypothetical protein